MRGLPDWYDDAECKGRTDEMFTNDRVEQLKACIRVCEGCPVKKECLAFYLVYRDEFAVAGGMTPTHRMRLTGLNRRATRYRRWAVSVGRVEEWVERNIVWEAHFDRIRAHLRRLGHGDI